MATERDASWYHKRMDLGEDFINGIITGEELEQLLEELDREGAENHGD